MSLGVDKRRRGRPGLAEGASPEWGYPSVAWKGINTEGKGSNTKGKTDTNAVRHQTRQTENTEVSTNKRPYETSGKSL